MQFPRCQKRRAFLLLLLSVAPFLAACSDATSTTTDATLTIVEPEDGSTTSESRVTIRGLTQPLAEVAFEKSFSPDKRIKADANGQWEIEQELDKGKNEFKFHVVDSEDTKAKLVVQFDPSASPARPTAAASAAPPIADGRVAELESYLKTNFGLEGYKTSWYDLIKGVSIVGSTAVVETSIRIDAEGRRFASSICSAVSGLVFPNQDLGLASVQIRAQDGSTIILRSNVSESC